MTEDVYVCSKLGSLFYFAASVPLDAGSVATYDGGFIVEL